VINVKTARVAASEGGSRTSFKSGTVATVADRGLFLSCSVFATNYTDAVVSKLESIFADHKRRQTTERKTMLHLIWYIIVGLIAGVIAKAVLHVHMTIFWTIVLGIIGSIIGGAVTHMFTHPVTGRFHPAGLIFSTLGAILVLYICIRLNIHFPRVIK
jgi:uncharacterized membrane protein YeaQ/YmgE (transglycosylase-associated protein family)